MTINTEKDVAECLTDAHASGRKIRIVGGGTRQTLGNSCDADATLSTAALNDISLYEPSALTIVTAAGTPLDDIQKTLLAEGQRLPFEPMDHRGLLGSTGTPTIGGVVACNISGPARIQAGSCRDSLIGVRMVDGMGQVIKNGGRVMKNVTGYDLVKLMAGSFGTLGVLTEVAFKVLPKPETSATLLVKGLNDQQAIHAMTVALTAPYDVNGAAHMAQDNTTLIRVEGFENSVTYRCEQLKNLLASYGDISISDDASLWKSVRDVAPFHGTDNSVWRISVSPSNGAKVGAALHSLSDTTELIYDWGGGLIWASMPNELDVRVALNGIKGTIECVRGQGQKRAPQIAAIAKIEHGLRLKFDPKGILNNGIMG